MSVPGGSKSEYSPDKTLAPVYHTQNGDEDDPSSQWLSSYVEECLFSSGNCILPPTTAAAATTTTKTLLEQSSTNLKTTHQIQNPPLSPPHYFNNNQTHPSENTSSSSYSDPLIPQAYWLADSELLVPQKENKTVQDVEKMIKISDDQDEDDDAEDQKMGFDPKDSSGNSLKNRNTGLQPRRCTHCLAYKTPLWRAGPLGPKTLCNACGVRFKSGRLLPEYRPAKSPTFESDKYSNSHKKVMEMRMSGPSSMDLE